MLYVYKEVSYGRMIMLKVHTFTLLKPGFPDSTIITFISTMIVLTVNKIIFIKSRHLQSLFSLNSFNQ